MLHCFELHGLHCREHKEERQVDFDDHFHVVSTEYLDHLAENEKKAGWQKDSQYCPEKRSAKNNLHYYTRSLFNAHRANVNPNDCVLAQFLLACVIYR